MTMQLKLMTYILHVYNLCIFLLLFDMEFDDQYAIELSNWWSGGGQSRDRESEMN